MFNVNGKNYEKVWFTSDEHYTSDRHIKLSQRREFMTVQPEDDSSEVICDVAKMDATFITNHNKLISDNDLVIHLGDFGNRAIVKYLTGDHILLVGNYEDDEIKVIQKEQNISKLKAFNIFRNRVMKENKGFVDVCQNMIFGPNDVKMLFGKEISKDVDKIYLTHKPEDCIKTAGNNVWTINSQIADEPFYIMNIFGHIHEKAKCKRFGLNVGVDCNHYYPVSCEEVSFYLNAILHYYDQNVFM